MPLYVYRCFDCEEQVEIEHGINQPVENSCLACGLEGTLEQVPFAATIKKERENKGPKVGQVTSQYIEENREILKQEMEKRKNKVWEPE